MRVRLTRHSIARRSFAAEARRAPAWRQRIEEASAVGEGTAGAAPGTPGRATGGAMSAAAVAGTTRDDPHDQARGGARGDMPLPSTKKHPTPLGSELVNRERRDTPVLAVLF